MSTIVVTGAAGPLGRRAVALAVADPSVDEVVAVDVEPLGAVETSKVHAEQADLATADLKAIFEGGDVVVHLASAYGPALDDDPALQGGVEIDLARRVLDAAGDAAVGHLILLSSATVYGAWANNPVPLTEEATLRPNPDCGFAVHKAEIERLTMEWADSHPTATVALLRPVATVADGRAGWLGTALASAPAPVGSDEPPAQFLDLDDLATAVDRVRRCGREGAFNVAPDGWLTGAEAKALGAGTPRLRTPARLAGRLATFRWRFRLAPSPPGLVPYRWQPWVVANDRLKATGWEPRYTNEEAYVAGHAAGPWATLSPRRRQELALGGAAVALGGAAAGAVALLRRRA